MHAAEFIVQDPCCLSSEWCSVGGVALAMLHGHCHPHYYSASEITVPIAQVVNINLAL